MYNSNKLWKIQKFLLPTQTIEQKNFLHKRFELVFRITDIKHNIVGIPLVTKRIPSKLINIRKQNTNQRQIYKTK